MTALNKLSNTGAEIVDPDFDYYIAKERGGQISKNALASLISEAGISSLTVYLLWDMFSHRGLSMWLAAALFASVFAFGCKLAFRSRQEFSPPRWYALIMLCSVFLGLAWGMVPVLFFQSDNILFLAIVISLYTGCTSGGLVVNSTYFPSFLAFGLSFAFPFIASMVYQGEQPYTSVAIVATFHIFSLIYISHNMQSTFLESARVQFEKARLLDELAQEKKAVELAVATKDRFLAAASHDLRQPLNAINLFMDALRPLQSKQLGGEIIDKVQLSLKGLNGMLHSLLDIAELDANTVQNRPTHLSIYTLVESIVAEYQSKASHIELRNEVDRELVVFCDQTILYRVIHNLLDNAVKYTEQGQVLIECKHKANICELYIRDSGMGIPQNQIDLVFDEFHQLNNPERDRTKGLGLGLAIVKRLCDLALIELELTSQPGKGSTVMLKLATGIETSIMESSAELSINFSGELIVIIDDEQDIRQAMQLVLSALHADVIIAESLDQAMQELAQASVPPSIIISDFRLRDNATGAQAIDAIREEYNREIPAIIITGDTGVAKLSEMREVAECVLYKPVDTQELQGSIASLLGQKET